MCAGVGKFFGLGQPCGLRRNVVMAALAQLKSLEAWFLRQRAYAFYASSLLFIYSSHGGDTTAGKQHVDGDIAQLGASGVASTGVNVCSTSDSVVGGKGSDATSATVEPKGKEADGEKAGGGFSLKLNLSMASGFSPLALNLITGQKRNAAASSAGCEGSDVDVLPDPASKQAKTAQPGTLSEGENGSAAATTNQNHYPLVEVRMIDFAHVFPADGKRDDNYLFGLQKLIGYLEELLLKE